MWITEFPLFTRADTDKDFLAHGRWSSSHHPFTAPMLEDIEALYAGKVDRVRARQLFFPRLVIAESMAVRRAGARAAL